jgi:uncharacterized membrane protein
MKLSYLWRGQPGHPLHPPLTDVTIGAYTFATIAAILNKVGIADQAAAKGWWLALAVALCSSVLTVGAGFVDWLAIERGTPLFRTATTHMLVMVVITTRLVPTTRIETQTDTLTRVQTQIQALVQLQTQTQTQTQTSTVTTARTATQTQPVTTTRTVTQTQPVTTTRTVTQTQPVTTTRTVTTTQTLPVTVTQTTTVPVTVTITIPITVTT